MIWMGTKTYSMAYFESQIIISHKMGHLSNYIPRGFRIIQKHNTVKHNKTNTNHMNKTNSVRI